MKAKEGVVREEEEGVVAMTADVVVVREVMVRGRVVVKEAAHGGRVRPSYLPLAALRAWRITRPACCQDAPDKVRSNQQPTDQPPTNSHWL